ncbi:MAG: hypothetical protein F6K19_33865 [Cyanothece sp. SIO1E1]|nr:hypothetical protein [Cyanothece sp. SIO1E1]
MPKIILALAGAGTGGVATILCVLLGLQANYFKTLATVNILTGLCASLVGNAALTTYRKHTHPKTITRLEIERATGVLNERYALRPNAEEIAVALEEFKHELNRDLK